MAAEMAAGGKEAKGLVARNEANVERNNTWVAIPAFKPVVAFWCLSSWCWLTECVGLRTVNPLS
jgi:hypothetical protein